MNVAIQLSFALTRAAISTILHPSVLLSLYIRIMSRFRFRYIPIKLISGYFLPDLGDRRVALMLRLVIVSV